MGVRAEAGVLMFEASLKYTSKGDPISITDGKSSDHVFILAKDLNEIGRLAKL